MEKGVMNLRYADSHLRHVSISDYIVSELYKSTPMVRLVV